jgi:amidase
MTDAGATLVDVEIPSFDEFNSDQSEIIVLIFEFKRDLNAYLATRSGVPARTLAEVIQFNIDHADPELKFFGQELMELAEAEVFSEADYMQALVRGPQLAGAQGIDAVLAANNLDAIVAPTNTPAWPNDPINGDAFLFGSSGFAAVAGYPLVTVTMGFVFDLPVGITFMASAWSEPTLIRLASGFEAAADVRRRPRFLRTFDPNGKSHGHKHGSTMDVLAARSASSAMQRHASKLDPLLVPRLRRLMYL